MHSGTTHTHKHTHTHTSTHTLTHIHRHNCECNIYVLSFCGGREGGIYHWHTTPLDMLNCILLKTKHQQTLRGFAIFCGVPLHRTVCIWHLQPPADRVEDWNSESYEGLGGMVSAQPQSASLPEASIG